VTWQACEGVALQNQQVLPHDDFISNLDVSPKELLLRARGLDDIQI
jgi:hypothetical protein